MEYNSQDRKEARDHTTAFIGVVSNRSKGDVVVSIQELYTHVGAKNISQKNGVQWSIRDLKDKGIVSRVYDIYGKKVKGMYIIK